MSRYCIGDLHGDYELFIATLDKVNFDYKNDKMYVLGDVMSGKYGAIKIFQHMMNHNDSFELIQGNHESQFIYMIKAYDLCMLEEELKVKIRKVMEFYSEKIFKTIENNVIKVFKHKDIISLKKENIVKKWLLVSKKRELMLNSILDLILFINYDEEKFRQINWVLHNTEGHFKTKQFVKELLELNKYEYMDLRKYISESKREIRFHYMDKNFWLKHSNNLFSDLKKWSVENRKIFRHIPDVLAKDIYLIYGHEPVPKIHRRLFNEQIEYCRTFFEFNYREIFTYIDSSNNHYFNLDLGSNPVGVLKLDNLEEVYVKSMAKRRNSTTVEASENITEIKAAGYRMVNEGEFYCLSRKKAKKCDLGKEGFCFITFKDCCQQFFVGVNIIKKEIYYIRVDFLDYPYYVQMIKKWYNGQEIKEIINKVNFDYEQKMNQPEYIDFEKYIRQIEI